MKLSHTLAHLFHPRRSNNHRPRILHPESYIFLSMVVVGFFLLINKIVLLHNSFGNILGFASSITPSQVIEQTNQQRAAAGLPPLTVNKELTQAALAKGQHMLDKQYWAHVGPDGTEPWKFMKDAGYVYQVAGENLARDFSNTDSMVQAWMASPTHRANIMNGKYQEIGIAVIDGHLEGFDTTLVVQMFGTPKVTQAKINQDLETRTVVAQAPESQKSPAEADQLQQQPSENLENGGVTGPGGLNPQPTLDPSVLAGALVITGSFKAPPLFTPLQLMKSFFLALILLIIGTLFYDAFIMGHSNTIRLVGKNMAHIILMSVVAFLLILFKGGIVQ